MFYLVFWHLEISRNWYFFFLLKRGYVDTKRLLTSAWFRHFLFQKNVLKMAAEKSVPSDLFKCVYSFLVENKFTKAAQEFLKKTKVVSSLRCVAVFDGHVLSSGIRR